MRGAFLVDMAVIVLALLGFAWWHQLPPDTRRVRSFPLRDEAAWVTQGPRPMTQISVRLYWYGDSHALGGQAASIR